MLHAPLAARELERLRAERAAEIARQLPLYVDTPPPELIRGREDDEDGETARPLPDWATNY